MSRTLRRIETVVPRRAPEFGGKASALASLARAGFPVPAAYALSAEVGRRFVEDLLPETERLPALLERAHVSDDRLEAIARRIREAPMPESLADLLSTTLATLVREGATSIAVRSSSTREDQEAASAAGMHHTTLHVKDERALREAVKACWASLYSPRVLAYLRASGETGDAAVGVVLQAMVPADVAGVLFTVNPLTGDAGEIVINAAYGLGTSVVDGHVSPDTWRIDKSLGLPRDRILGSKDRRIVVRGGEGLVEEEVAPALRDRLCLDERTVERLVDIGLRVEEHFDSPRDVEFALVGGELYLLQARPVTTAIQPGTRHWQKKRRPGTLDRTQVVWSNVNVGEALPGVATPLTWSVLGGFSELGFRRAFGALGLTVPRDTELVAGFRGRIYLNLSELMGILSQVPGLRPRMLLAFGGGGEVDRLEAGIEGRSSVGFLTRLPLTAARFARDNLRLDQSVAELEERFESERRRLRAFDPRLLSPVGLSKMLGEVERLLDETGAVMLHVYGSLLAAVAALHVVLRVLVRERASELQRDLLTGLADVSSAAPGLALFHIAEMATRDDGARGAILSRDATSLSVEGLPDGPTRRALARFLEAYGHRGAREAEIGEPRWSEDATLLFATFQAHLRGGRNVPAPLDTERRLRAIRERAEGEIASKLPAPARPAFRHVLAIVQRLTRLRERLRDHVVEILGLFRTVALDASRRIHAREPEAGHDAAFFLSLGELHGVLRGDVGSVAPRVQRRRHQYDRDRALPNPPDTFVGFPPPVPAEIEAGTDRLVGLSASGGCVTGRARVLHGPADASGFESGEVLVTSVADVGWSPLFLLASAVVTDLGGPLSHAAIVLREYGVPAVVNVKIGTKAIHDGDLVEVDADAGIVRIVERA